MKYLIILAILATGCNVNHRVRVLKEANELCKCYGGLRSLQLTSIDYLLICRDKQFSGPMLNIKDISFAGGCK